MVIVEAYSRTPSLTNSEETVASSSDLYAKPLPQPPPIDISSKTNGKGKERAIPRPHVAQRPASIAAANPRSSRFPSTYANMHTFVRTWSQPRILKHLLSCIGWPEFQAVSRTCRDLRQIFRDPDVKNITLSRFVPGYKDGSDSLEGGDEDIRVSLADLEALMLSQSLPLHQYPMHAVHVETAEGDISPPAKAFSDRLIHLAQAHSRFVLLLRARAPPWQFNFDSDELLIRQNGSLSGLRELIFPAPLSYFDPSKKAPPLPPPELKRRRSKRKHLSADPQSSPRAETLPNPPKRRLSIFGRSKERTPLPAPQSSPPSMKYYSSFRRRVTSMSMTDDESGPTFSRHSRFMTDTLTPPRSPFAYPKSSSSNSSLGSMSRSVSSPLQPSGSPHDLSNALLRTRAPILRVFVPCSTLSESLAAAERQLFTSGLWQHLRIGDTVCNLGYVPEDSGSARGWLVYTGAELYPFFPPEPAPVPDAKALPSPLYYSHLLPPFDNPRAVLELPRGMRMTLNLALLSSSAPSPHSRTGFVRVKRYSWLGRLRVREEDTEALGLGEGWAGEWVLEAEGTKEGRQMLIDAIEENEQRPAQKEWLVVREKSGAGKVWLRVIPEPRTLDNLSVEL